MENRPKKKPFDLVREAIQRKHYSKRTEKALIHCIKSYIFFHNKRNSLEMSRPRWFTCTFSIEED